MHRAALGHDLGWFDDDFFLYYEDTDLSWRIRSRGYPSATSGGGTAPRALRVECRGSPLFVFHTDRNRLLMLTKTRRCRWLLSAVARYPLDDASIGVRTLRQAWRARSRPAGATDVAAASRDRVVRAACSAYGERGAGRLAAPRANDSLAAGLAGAR